MSRVSLKLGLNTGFWASRPPAPATLQAVQEAERLGFDSVWTSEAYGADVLSPLAWWGSRTDRVRLGTSIMQMSARRPTAAAMAAITMDHLSGGRFVLGLGASVEDAMARDWQQRIPRLLSSEDYVEGPRAFSEKRRPVWTGR